MQNTEQFVVALVHGDSSVRARLVAAAGRNGLHCVDAESVGALAAKLDTDLASAGQVGQLSCRTSRRAPPTGFSGESPHPRILAVALQIKITKDRARAAGESVRRARHLFSHSLVIAILPGSDPSSTRDAFRVGAWDCLSEPVEESEFIRCLNEAVAWSGILDAAPSQKNLGALTPESVSRWMKRAGRQLRCTRVESTRALVAAVEARDPYTQEHSLTVAGYAESIGKRMGLGRSKVKSLRAAAMLHDVGKIGVPDAILTKQGPLTDREFDVVKRHPRTAVDILGHLSFLSDERPLILHHHERYDGKGYPARLTGDKIPLGARILAVADAMDAMFSPRSYKDSYDLRRVRKELTAGAGRQFDPAVTRATLELLDQAPGPLSSLRRRQFAQDRGQDAAVAEVFHLDGSVKA